MKCVYVSFIFLFIVSVRADEKNSSESLIDLKSEGNDSKSSEKRWAQDSVFPSSIPNPKDTIFQSNNGLGLSNRKIERAKEEKTLRDFIPMKDDFHGIFINALKPRPIVDTASEAEKSAPNYGSGTEGLGDLVVRGSETLSKALLSILNVPRKAFGKLSSGATQALNQLGAYLTYENDEFCPYLQNFRGSHAALL